MTAADPSRDQRVHWRRQEDALRKVGHEVQRVGDLLAQLIVLLETRPPQVTAAARPEPQVPGPAPDDVLTGQEVADLLKVPLTTLRAWRSTGSTRGPAGMRVGRHVRYRRADVERWIAQQAQYDRSADHRAGTPIPARGVTLPASPLPRERCGTHDISPARLSSYPGRGVCPTCGGDPILKRDGRLPKHFKG